MRGKQAGIFFYTILVMSILLVTAAAVGFSLYFTNNFTNDLKAFYVQYGSLEIARDVDIEVEADKNAILHIKYTLGFPVNETGSRYFVEVSPTGNNFDFKVNGEVHSYQGDSVTGFSQFFILHEGVESLILYVSSKLTMQSMLDKIFEGESVTDVPNIDIFSGKHFELRVSSYDKKTVYKIGLNFIKGGQ